MSGKRALLDSNTIIYLSKHQIPAAILDQFDDHFISIITYMEVLGYRFQKPDEKELVKDILNLCEILYMDLNIAEIVIELRKQHRIKLPDAIIAATAIYHDFTLITGDTEDFNGLGLNISNPFQQMGID
ncbi:MAG: type II toxin-antitoxin system VapC family toxin [Acidobacteriota bacterium]